MNKIIITCNTTKDIEKRVTPNGKSVATLGVAINDGWGEKKTTTFINVVAWGKQAELDIPKGTKLCISGRLSERSWQDKEGNKKKFHEIIAESIEFLSKKEETTSKEEKPNNFNEAEVEEDIVIPGEQEMF